MPTSTSRHSCDELLSRSFHEGSSSAVDAGAGAANSGEDSACSSDCQRCLLSELSSRTLSLDCEGLCKHQLATRYITRCGDNN